jgi:hypothetical protein
MQADPVTLNSADRAKLVGILGLLSSDKAGERDAAAHAASRFLKARDLQWADILGVPPPDPIETWRQEAMTCARYGAGILSPWELNFCRSLSGFSNVSPKQLVALRRMLDKLTLAGAMP